MPARHATSPRVPRRQYAATALESGIGITTTRLARWVPNERTIANSTGVELLWNPTGSKAVARMYARQTGAPIGHFIPVARPAARSEMSTTGTTNNPIDPHAIAVATATPIASEMLVRANRETAVENIPGGRMIVNKQG